MNKHLLRWDEAVVACAHTKVFSKKHEDTGWPDRMTPQQLAVLQWPYVADDVLGPMLTKKRSQRIMEACESGELIPCPASRGDRKEATRITSNSFGAWLVAMEEEPSRHVAAWLASQPLSVAVRTASLSSAQGQAHVESQTSAHQRKLDFYRLATKTELIAAYGAFTGMNNSWFNRLDDIPALKKARKVSGIGRKDQTLEALFCPYEVLIWLLSPKRRKGRSLSTHKGWQLFSACFPDAYKLHSKSDPRDFAINNFSRNEPG